jgi:hypothetical protein
MFAALYLIRAAGPSGDLLVRLAGEFSPRVALEAPDLAILDIGGVQRMFGTAREVGEELRRAAADRGLAARVAVAATRTAATVAALGRPGLTVIAPGDEAAALAPLPVRVLERFAVDEPDPRRSRAGRAGHNSRHYRMAPAPHSRPAPEFDAGDAVAVNARGDGVAAARRPVAAPARGGGAPRELNNADGDARTNSSALFNAPGAPPPGAPRASRDALWACRPSGRPLSALLPDGIFATLRRWGLKTLGDVAALPRGDLFERLGDAGLALQRLAAGLDTTPLVPLVVSEPFEQSLELEWPIEGLDPLSFVLSRLLEPLCSRLEREDCGAAGLHVVLRLVSRETHARSLQLPAPFRDPRVLRTLALLDLESHPPTAGIDRVTVTIDPAPGRILQFSLIERALPAAESLSTLLARLRALMGDARVGSAALVDTHQPGAFEMGAFAPMHPSGAKGSRGAEGARGARGARAMGAPGSGSAAGAGANGAGANGAGPEGTSGARDARTVLRRVRQPGAIRVRVVDGQPAYVASGRTGMSGGSVTHAAGPWRTSGRWWERIETSPPATTRDWRWNREEWDVVLADGVVYRIFLDRDSQRWFLEAVAD